MSHWSFRDLCKCDIAWSTDTGHYDPVTGEWDPHAPINVVSLRKADDCPIHADWYFDIKVKILEIFRDGWAQVRFPDSKLWKLWRDQILDRPMFNDSRNLEFKQGVE